MAWKVKRERPDETHEPTEYYEKEAQHYESPGMVREQARITQRAIELLGAGKGRVLDAGCGTGVSMRVLEDSGFDVKGIDVSPEMIAIARKKKLEASVASMDNTPFPDNSFRAIISISALQWVKSPSKVAKEFHRILEKSGRAVIQFYPKSEEDMMRAAKAFARLFETDVVIDNPQLPRKRKVFLVLKAL
ncbi:MAG: methyltransferase domain-containing protein [Candidatus Diapherotrites archaeon]|nr:methyltransferase domain-containing protein [Candidatus Diapherotrites archaeon]